MSETYDVIDNAHRSLEGASFSAGADLNLRVADDCARFSLRIKGAHLEKAIAAFGGDIAAKIGGMASGDGRSALCLGPDEWLLMAPLAEGQAITVRFAGLGVAHSLVDVGHRTVGLEITGPASAMTLNAGCPLDLGAMKPGTGTRTVLDKAEIILIKYEREHYRLEIVRSFAPFVWNFLTTTGREFDIYPPESKIET